MKRLLSLAIAIPIPILLPDGASKFETQVSSNNVPILSLSTNVVAGQAVFEFEAATNSVYRFTSSVTLSNGVQTNLPTLWYTLVKSYPHANDTVCRGDEYAWTTNALGQPMWTFAHLPCRFHRRGGVGIPPAVIQPSPVQGLKYDLRP